ncbi:MAG TPA: sigma-70 family RNA polymerase sigma factor [Micropepsaceae bacterium]|nr:sigma-70 family RNA polymerase sigma factor [Micropepsaceae bacterium]
MNFAGPPLKTHDWDALMARAQQGDQAAYRDLLNAVLPWLRNIASARFRARDEVEDAVQDILLTLHAIRHTYDPVRPFKPWLMAVAKRRIADRLRVKIRRSARETFLSPEHETFAGDETNPMEQESEAKLLREAVSQLPEGQRKAVTMLKLEEKSLAETSALTGMSVTALKVSTHRALSNLRKLLEKP